MKKVIVSLISFFVVQVCFSQNITGNESLNFQPVGSSSPFNALAPTSSSIQHSETVSNFKIGQFQTTGKKKRTVVETAALYTLIGMAAGGLIGWIASPGGNKGDEESSKGYGAAVGIAAGGAIGFPVGIVVGLSQKKKSKAAM